MKVSDAMKLAILADIHGNDVAFEAVIKDMADHQVNCVVFLGDLVAKGPQPMECFERMTALKPLIWLKGDTEYWLDNAMIDIMPTSPENIQLLEYYDYMVKHMDGPSMDTLIGLEDHMPIKIGHFEGYCCHGSLRDSDEKLDPFGAEQVLFDSLAGFTGSFVLSAHTHRQYDTMVRGVRLINPGSVGAEVDGEEGKAAYALLEIGDSFKVSLRQVPYDASKLLCIEGVKSFPGMNSHRTRPAYTITDLLGTCERGSKAVDYMSLFNSGISLYNGLGNTDELICVSIEREGYDETYSSA